MFEKSLLNEIRERVSLVALIGERVPLKRAGRNYVGLCPFHREKTPSFSVNDEKGIYHCFGCGEGGDAFQFLLKFEGGTFADAVRTLAARAGVTLPERQTDPRQRAAEDEADRRRRWLLRVNEIAREHFRANLAAPQGARARAYLEERGLKAEIWTQHFIGYADNGWDALVKHLQSRQVPLELAAELGLIKRRDGGGQYDFFRHRVIFPILSPRGEVLGFGGRALAGGVDGERGAKYLNSPDSPVYHKSSCVYGLDRSAAAIRAADQVVLVEGYMDFIALHQAGIEQVAAPLGTALTAGHISVLARATRNMVLIFDGDEAGARASLRALAVFLESGIMPRVVTLPAGEDPDTLVRREGADAFRGRIGRAKPLFEHFVDAVVAETGLDSAGKVAALQQVVPLLRKAADPVEQAVLRQHVARRLDVDEASVARAVGGQAAASAARPQASPGPRASAVGTPQATARLSGERLLIRTMLSFPETIPGVFTALGPGHFQDEWCRTVAALMLKDFGEACDRSIGAMIDRIDDHELASQLRALAMEPGAVGEPEAGAIVKDCVELILARPDEERLEAINEEIRRAEGAGDDPHLMQLLKEKSELAARMRA